MFSCSECSRYVCENQRGCYEFLELKLVINVGVNWGESYRFNRRSNSVVGYDSEV